MPANPRVKNQRCCGKDVCQRERKRKWRQAKMATDADIITPIDPAGRKINALRVKIATLSTG
jgi:hypothetical protein